ncbi:hypothetical protein, partial [Cupriavidus nantongensis]|uniref:hypothetical protein n=1 Tax=Cupriavidus nantongensis TaxID=1796606 RepID=UPI00224743B0
PVRLMSCATPILPSGPVGHVPEMPGHVPEIAGHDPETAGHVRPKYAVVCGPQQCEARQATGLARMPGTRALAAMDCIAP